MPIVNEQSAGEFFREQLEKAMEHQRVSTSAFTEYYLVRLLTGRVHAAGPAEVPGIDEMPLALIYVEALRAARAERTRLLRTLGDTALFVSGFFADSLNRRLCDLAYYRDMGGYAYRRLSLHEGPATNLPGVYSELGRRFTTFADVLAEVSEATRLSTPASVVRLYDRWLRTGSRRAASLLADQGIAPVRSGPEDPQ